jgi:hypothetical protein
MYSSAVPRYPHISQLLYSPLLIIGVTGEDVFTARANRAWQGKPDARDWTSRGPRRRERRKPGKSGAPRSHRRRRIQQWSFRPGDGRPKVARPAGRVTGRRGQQWQQLPVTPQALAVGLSPCFGEADERIAKDLTGRRRWGNPNDAFLSFGLWADLAKSKSRRRAGGRWNSSPLQCLPLAIRRAGWRWPWGPCRDGPARSRS